MQKNTKKVLNVTKSFWVILELKFMCLLMDVNNFKTQIMHWFCAKKALVFPFKYTVNKLLK